MYKMIAYHPRMNKYLLMRKNVTKLYVNIKMLNFMIKLGLII